MIIAKAEEREDIGVTIGAILGAVLAVSLAVFATALALDTYAPDLAARLGITSELLSPVLMDLPIWLLAAGLGLSYFTLYIVAKRAARHSLKKKRAKELARVRGN
jgi:hypothetical protein